MSVNYNYVDAYQTLIYESFVNLTKLNRTLYPATTTVEIDSINPTLTSYFIYDQWALRGIENSIYSSGGFWNFTTPAAGTTITAFSVTTTSGTITINWGDNSSNTISSGSLVNKTY